MSLWIEFKVMQKKEHLTIRQWLAAFYMSKSNMYKLEVHRGIKLNNILVKLDVEISLNDILSFDFSIIASTSVLPSNHTIHIVYEDEDLLVVNKEVGLLVHGDGTQSDTLTHRVAYYMMQKNYPYPVLPVHRIDTVTSGMVVFAKHPLALSYMSAIFERREVLKKYVCMVEGLVRQDRMTIQHSIGKHRHENKQMISPTGKNALTTIKVISREISKSRVEAMIEGGRKHQIRVHLASVGHPVVGDVLYGGRRDKRVHLHFCYIKFIHPRTFESIEIDCPTPF